MFPMQLDSNTLMFLHACSKCRRTEPPCGFHKNRAQRSGWSNWCKDCRREKDMPKDHPREYTREYIRKWRAAHPGYMKRYRDAWKTRYPEKRWAQKTVSNAVHRGKLQKQPCEVCGVDAVEAHHEDYERPLDVRWLCLTHHRELHTRKKVDNGYDRLSCAESIPH